MIPLNGCYYCHARWTLLYRKQQPGDDFTDQNVQPQTVTLLQFW